MIEDIDVQVQEVHGMLDSQATHGMLRGTLYTEEPGNATFIGEKNVNALSNNSTNFDSTECTYEDGSKNFITNYLVGSSGAAAGWGILSGIFLRLCAEPITETTIEEVLPSGIITTSHIPIQNTKEFILSVITNAVTVNAVVITDAITKDPTISLQLTASKDIVEVIDLINGATTGYKNSFVDAVAVVLNQKGIQPIANKFYPSYQYSCYYSSGFIQVIGVGGVIAASTISLIWYHEDCIDAGTHLGVVQWIVGVTPLIFTAVESLIAPSRHPYSITGKFRS